MKPSVANALLDKRATLGGAPEYMRNAFAAGVSDWAAGKGYQAAYEKAPLAQQLFYEYGRLEAANIAAAGLPVPPWDGRDGAARRRLVALSLRAAKRTGNPIPPAVAEDALP